MSAQDLIDEAKRIRQRLRYPPNAVKDPGIDLTRKSTAHKGSEPVPDPPIKKPLIEFREPTYPALEVRFPVTFDDILEAVSQHYGVTVGILKGGSRRAHTVFARFVAIYLSLRILPTRSLKSIGRDLGKDHSTIIHARNRFLAIIAGNSQVATEVQMIEKYIETVHNSRLPLPAFHQLDLAGIRQESVSQQEVHGLEALGAQRNVPPAADVSLQDQGRIPG